MLSPVDTVSPQGRDTPEILARRGLGCKMLMSKGSRWLESRSINICLMLILCSGKRDEKSLGCRGPESAQREWGFRLLPK